MSTAGAVATAAVTAGAAGARDAAAVGARDAAAVATRDAVTAATGGAVTALRGRVIGVPSRGGRDILGTVQTQVLSPVFIGRDAELNRLAAALAATHGGEPQAVLIGGEAGVGKTRLVERFLAAVRETGAVTAVGGCVEIGADGLPFAPVATALRDLHRTLGAELTAAVAGQENELARLLPDLGENGGAVRDPHDEEGRVRLFELTARLLERLGADRTLVVVVEDLHWADRSTRELLAYLFRSLQRARVLVAATYRTDDIHRRHPLRPFLAETDRLRTVDRIELPRFNHDEVRRQLAAILGAEPERAVVDQIFARSDGNPFFVEELACSVRKGCAPVGISDSLRDLLLVRVEALSDDAQRVAKFVAEGGNAVEYRLLEAISGLDEDRLLDALRTAVGANILLPTENGDGYRFRHSLVREAVGDDLLPGERSRINRHYAEAVEADPTLVRADERAARLASYWYAAHDPAKALPAVLRASVEARHRHAYAEQYRLLERALELWDDTPRAVRDELRPMDYAESYPQCGCDPDAPLSFLDLLAEVTVAARMGGERERAYAIAKRGLKLMERDKEDDPLRAAWFWAQRSRLTEDLGRGDGWEELSRARELVRGLPPSAAQAEVLASIAGWIMIHKSGAEGIAIARRAVDLARLSRARDTELHARVTLGLLQADAGDVEAGIAEVEDVRRLIGEQQVPPGMIARTYGNLSSVLESAGRSEEALRVVREGKRLTGMGVSRLTSSWMLINEAESLISLGRYEDAAVPLAAADRAIDKSYLRAGLEIMSGFRALAIGDTGAAARHHTAALAGIVHDTQPQHILPVRTLAIQLAAAQGRFADARRELLAGLAAGFPAGTSRFAWPTLAIGAAAEADGPGAEPGVLERIRATARELPRPVPLYEAYAFLVDAELARAEGRVEPELWAVAQEAFAKEERPVELAAVRYRHAEALLASGGAEFRERAGCLLAEAHAVASEAGARPLADSVTRLAQRARLTLHHPAAASGAPADPADPRLTARERDVLRLVSEGRTNRQIAQALFISPKTASVHVSNILAKLAVSTRGEAAATAHRLGLFAD
ncbi:helix-turn-helix transcriptional regulator [Streptomyces sp. HPF1205]|uniref:helix-turn-helix transcriptional regulator n=1 Tax=Streptomyces sp. HPF1205 TaxID=2873262 RepID=UPI0021F1001E|nr:helix-turn-helix transcriptional regulator [Streptomyces sp. HPF1205]